MTTKKVVKPVRVPKAPAVDLGQLQSQLGASYKEFKSAQQAAERANQRFVQAEDGYRRSMLALRGGQSVVEASVNSVKLPL